MKKFRSGFTKFCRAIQYVSMVVTMFAVVVTVIDIILKLTTHFRILGNMEMVELGMVIMMYLCFGLTQLENGHVRVDMFVNMLPPKGRCAVNGVMQFVCCFFCILLAIQSYKQVSTHIAASTSSQVLHIPYSPFSAIMCIGFVLYAIAIFITAVEYFIELPHAQPIER